MNKITPFLWFNADAELAADFYLKVFPNARKLNELRWPEIDLAPGSGHAGAVLALDLELEGQQVTFLNGGPSQQLTEAFSFVIRCETQAEIDRYWAALIADGGAEHGCGWLKDKFGVSWQVVPVDLTRLVRHPAAMKAMMSMKKTRHRCARTGEHSSCLTRSPPEGSRCRQRLATTGGGTGSQVNAWQAGRSSAQTEKPTPSHEDRWLFNHSDVAWVTS